MFDEKCINRMNDVIDICKVTGNIEMDGININDKDLDVELEWFFFQKVYMKYFVWS